MERLEKARHALDTVVALGVRVLIDDFGTGYSSIARLGDLPVVGLKVDRRFTTALGTSAAADGIFASITSLAAALGMDLIVEGIEDAAMLARVRAQGCAFGQGYHLARPVPLDELMDLLALSSTSPPYPVLIHAAARRLVGLPQGCSASSVSSGSAASGGVTNL